MRKKYFWGKYYKFVGNDSFSFALIESESDDGKEKQLITANQSYQIKDVNSITISENKIIFNVQQEDLSLVGSISFPKLHPLRKKVMGPFSVLPLECKHEVYSMYHSLKGEVNFNGVRRCFDEGYGYIEGDSGVNFPEKYIWYNSVGSDYGVTLAIATIPFGITQFTGLLGFISFEGKEYYLCTYTLAKIKEMSTKKIVIAKGPYKLTVHIDGQSGHLLKAPINGSMKRYIKENIATPTQFEFTKNGEVLLSREDKFSSLEYMF